MWKKVTPTEPAPNEIYTTKIDPQVNKWDNERLYRHPTMGWLKTGTYTKALFEPTHWFDYSVVIKIS